MRRAIANLQIAFPETERTALSTLTVKYGTGYDVPWYVCDAIDLDEGRREILQFAGMTEATTVPDGRKVSELSLMELLAVVARIAQGVWAGRSAMGRTINKASKPAESSSATTAPKAEAAAAATPADDPEVAIREAIDNAATKAELAAVHKRFGADAFNADLLQHMKSRASKLS